MRGTDVFGIFGVSGSVALSSNHCDKCGTCDAMKLATTLALQYRAVGDLPFQFPEIIEW